MVIGETSFNLTKADIFSKFSEEQILYTVLPEITEIPCLICSPFRTDIHPSFYIYMNSKHHIKFIDYGDTSYKGDMLKLLCLYWKCNYNQALETIFKVLQNTKRVNSFKTISKKVYMHKEVTNTSTLQVKIRPWRDYDYKYWESYGITKEWLKYAEVYPISHKIVIKKDPITNKKNIYSFPADKYAYVYVERKEGKIQLKIYQPYNTKGYKWHSKMDASVIGLWSKIPKEGEKVIICSSLKDALVISCQLRIPTLCLQGEGYSMSNTAINELKKRYKKIFISFDTDIAGKIDANKLAKTTGFTNIVPNLGTEKDFSDYYKSLKDKSEFQKLKQLFN